jgi:hypothetical protein
MNTGMFLLPVFLLLFASFAKAQSEGALTVVNGDFSNIEGLTALPQSAWYSGVPTGWTAAEPPAKKEGFYAVKNFGATGFFANLHVLSRIKPQFQAFQQEIGVLAETSDITLTFETAPIQDEPFSLGAAIANARGKGPEAILGKANFEASGPQRVVASKVPAGTWVAIRFWAVKGFPGLGKVAIEVTPSP